MFGDMMGKLQQMQQQMEESKKLLDGVHVTGEAENGKVKVVATANRKIHNISIDPELLNDAEELEDLLLIALNRALEKANEKYEEEMRGNASGLLGGMGM